MVAQEVKNIVWKCYMKNYYVSDKGLIKNNSTGRILKLTCNHKGYKKTNISIDGKLRTVYIHRLVAELFVPNPKNLPQVNHKDGDKTNNSSNNLEWVTAQENIIHAHKTKLNKHTGQTRKISQYTLDNQYIRTFNGIREAARKVYGRDSANTLIWKCANNQLSNYKGYKWTYF